MEIITVIKFSKEDGDEYGLKYFLFPNFSNVEKAQWRPFTHQSLFPYYIKYRMDDGEVVTEKVSNRNAEKKFKKLFPEMYKPRR